MQSKMPSNRVGVERHKHYVPKVVWHNSHHALNRLILNWFSCVHVLSPDGHSPYARQGTLKPAAARHSSDPDYDSHCRLLFLGEEGEGALESSSLQMMLDLDPRQFVQTTKHKDDTNK